MRSVRTKGRIRFIRFKKSYRAISWLKKHPNRVWGVVVKKLPKPKQTLYKKAIRLAASQIGYKESPPGSNNCKYGVWCGVNREPWCAIFVSWVLSHVGRPFKETYVPHIVSLARNRQGGLRTILFSHVAAEIKAGNVVLACYDWPGESRGVADHVGIVEKVMSSSTFTAIEGNTSQAGSQSNGGEVCRQRRNVGQVQAFVLVKP